MTNTYTTAQGLTKDRYADKLANFLPNGVHLQQDVPFINAGQQIGGVWHQPVMVTYEAGATYSASAAGAFTVNAAVAAVLRDAQVQGSQFLFQAAIDYELLARAQNDKRAFLSGMDMVVKNIMTATARRVEVSELFGGTTIYSGIGIVQTAANPAFTITLASWSAGLWAGNENANLDAYDNDGAGGTPLTQRNTNAALVVVSTVLSTRVVTLSGNAADLAAIAAGDFFFFRGSYNAEGTGLVNIASNTGTLYNIAGGTYSMWQGNSFAVGGTAMTMQKLFDGLDGPAARGLDDETTFYCNPRTWSDLLSDQAALRKYDSSYSTNKVVNGSRRIEFFYQTGQVEIVSHRFLPEGIAVAFPKSRMKRLGSTDITNKVPGDSSEDFLFQLPTQAGLAMRTYTQQAIYCEAPSQCVLYTGIVNS